MLLYTTFALQLGILFVLMHLKFRNLALFIAYCRDHGTVDALTIIAMLVTLPSIALWLSYRTARSKGEGLAAIGWYLLCLVPTAVFFGFSILLVALLAIH